VQRRPIDKLLMDDAVADELRDLRRGWAGSFAKNWIYLDLTKIRIKQQKLVI
jgi:hypothetical protein